MKLLNKNNINTIAIIQISELFCSKKHAKSPLLSINKTTSPNIRNTNVGLSLKKSNPLNISLN